jgi:hypothetical protein
MRRRCWSLGPKMATSLFESTTAMDVRGIEARDA